MSGSQQPVAQLESLKYRTTQIMESITALQFLIEASGQPVMPSWPDILARYNLLLSQTHSLSVSLSPILAAYQQTQSQSQSQSQSEAAPNLFQKLALHPSMAIPEQQLDHALAPLLRNQPTVQVIKEEDASVRRIAAVLKNDAPDGYDEIIRECGEIRRAHDSRVERAVKAVTLLKDRYDWHARIDLDDLDKESGDNDEENRDMEEDEAREADDVLGQGTTPS